MYPVIMLLDHAVSRVGKHHVIDQPAEGRTTGLTGEREVLLAIGIEVYRVALPFEAVSERLFEGAEGQLVGLNVSDRPCGAGTVYTRLWLVRLIQVANRLVGRHSISQDAGGHFKPLPVAHDVVVAVKRQPVKGDTRNAVVDEDAHVAATVGIIDGYAFVGEGALEACLVHQETAFSPTGATVGREGHEIIIRRDFDEGGIGHELAPPYLMGVRGIETQIWIPNYAPVHGMQIFLIKFSIMAYKYGRCHGINIGVNIGYQVGIVFLLLAIV